MKSVLLIGNTISHQAVRLKEEADAQNLVFAMVNDKNIVLSNSTGKWLPYDKAFQLLDYDVYYFRGINNRSKELHELAKTLNASGKRVVEQMLTTSLLPDDKTVPPSERGLYRVPETNILFKADKELFKTLTFPKVLKGPGSQMGREVFVVQNAFELFKISRLMDFPIIIQEYIPIDFDVRIFIVGETVLGAMAYRKGDASEQITREFGKHREAYELTDEMKEAALEAKRQKGLEIAGIDMLVHDGQLYIIEVNESPNFAAFEECTQVNVAKAIINYLQRE